MRGRTGLYDTADIQQYVRAHKVGAADVAQGIAESDRCSARVPEREE